MVVLCCLNYVSWVIIHNDLIFFIFKDSIINCSYELYEGSIRANCSMGFSGIWPPTFEWRNRNGTLKPTEATVTHTGSSEVTSYLVVSVKDSDSLSCELTFKSENRPTDTTAENIPEFLKRCRFGKQEETGLLPKRLLWRTIVMLLLLKLIVDYVGVHCMLCIGEKEFLCPCVDHFHTIMLSKIIYQWRTFFWTYWCR